MWADKQKAAHKSFSCRKPTHTQAAEHTDKLTQADTDTDTQGETHACLSKIVIWHVKNLCKLLLIIMASDRLDRTNECETTRTCITYTIYKMHFIT